MGTDTKIDFLSLLLMKVQGIYHIAQAAILFLFINNVPKGYQMALNLFFLRICQRVPESTVKHYP